MKMSTVCLLAFLTVLAGCFSESDPVQPSQAGADRGLSTDTLRYDVDPSFDGRTLLVDWYHVSFESPLAVRTLATRPGAQAFALSGARGTLVLPAAVDSQFEFYAKFRQYASDEAAGEIKQAFVDSADIYESTHRWALAPLVAARSDELARLTLAQLGAGVAPADTGIQSGYVLLWVRDSIGAGQDALLVKRKLTGRFGAGWHLLRYDSSNRSLAPCPMSDTVRFRPNAPKPNLV